MTFLSNIGKGVRLIGLILLTMLQDCVVECLVVWHTIYSTAASLLLAASLAPYVIVWIIRYGWMVGTLRRRWAFPQRGYPASWMILSWIMLSNYTIGMIIGGNATEPFAPIVYSSADHTRYGDWLRLRKLCEFLPNENPRPNSIERGFGQEFVLHLAKEGTTANRALLRNVRSGEPALPDSAHARQGRFGLY